MPDWSHLIPADVSLLQAVLWVAAAGLLITVLVKLWPFIRNAVAIVDALVRLPQMDVRMGRLEKKVDSIHHETHKNDGSSLKDAVGRVEDGVSGLHGRMDDVDRQLTKLAQEDEALWAEIEQSNNPDE